jgi:acrylyl-CoA reductase (NADPH)
MSSNPFPALIVEKNPDGSQSSAAIRELPSSEALPAQGGNVLIRVMYSSLNYKDGLAVTGKGKILRQYPIIPGIDLAGVIEEDDPENGFQKGAHVLVTGYGIGEQFSGGYARFAKVKKEWIVPVPAGMTALQTMAVGTAGFTAMLAVLAIEDHGIAPSQKSKPDILVTGAAGGVGSTAIALLAKLGYKVIASTGRVAEQGDYLKDLGASELIHRDELTKPSGRLIESERWSGAVDTVGGETLASVLRQTRYRGNVAACGLAGGMSLPSSVLPFILRGVNLLGIDSVMCPRELRERAWQRLATDLDLAKLQKMTQVIALKEVPTAASDILAGKVRGRTVVDLDR